MRPEIRRPDTHARRGEAPLGGDAAAVGEGRDLAVLADRHDGDHVAAQLGNTGRQAGRDLDRLGVDAIFRLAVLDVGFAEVRVAREVGGNAGIAVGVAGGPDEDGLFGCAGLGEGGDRSVEVIAKFLFAVLIDNSRVADAQIHEVDGSAAVAPIERPLEPARPYIVVAVEARQRYRDIVAATRPGRDREHRDIGAPGDAAGRIHIGSVRVARPARDHARDCGAMGALVADLIRRPGQKFFGQRLAGEHRVPGIDPGVDHADGLAAARCHIDAMPQFKLCPGPVGANPAQAPLILEVVFLVVLVLDVRPLFFEFQRRQATQDSLNAGRRRRRRFRGPRLPWPAVAGPAVAVSSAAVPAAPSAVWPHRRRHRLRRRTTPALPRP